jgi:hypothetical protein
VGLLERNSEQKGSDWEIDENRRTSNPQRTVEMGLGITAFAPAKCDQSVKGLRQQTAQKRLRYDEPPSSIRLKADARGVRLKISEVAGFVPGT